MGDGRWGQFYFDAILKMCHFEHMVAITIRDLHMKTGDWVRRAARHEGIVVLDRKHPVARIVPFKEEESGATFADRKLVRGFAKMAQHKGDSAGFISEDRDRA